MSVQLKTTSDTSQSAEALTKPFKICWFGIYGKDHPRNYIFFDGFEKLGVEIIHCNVGAKERFKYFKLIRKFWSLRKDFDIVYIGFPAQFTILVAKVLTRKRVVMDAMSSAYESAVYVRKEIGVWHPKALKLLLLDWLSAICADQIITDTPQHTEYWSTWRFVRKSKIDDVPIGSSTKYFFPIQQKDRSAISTKLLVQYHGTYIRVQGLDVLIEAIKLLKHDPDIQFRFIGSGQEYPMVRKALEECCSAQVTFVGRIPFQDMNAYINEADVIFGLFGDAEKADRAVPNKLYEGIAAARTVINKDTPAVRDAFSEDAIVLVPRDPAAIAEAITKLKEGAVRASYAAAGHQAFLEHFTEEKVAARLLEVLMRPL